MLLRFSGLYVTSNDIWRFHHISVAFSEYMNLKNAKCLGNQQCNTANTIRFHVIYNIRIFASLTLFMLRHTFKMMSGKSCEFSSDNLAPGFRFPVSEDQPQKSIGLERRRQDSRGLNPLSILQPNCVRVFRF